MDFLYKIAFMFLVGLFMHTAVAQTEDVEVIFADVIGVEVTGDPGKYIFSVAVNSPDTGCDQYADWWEVISMEGDLIYRRILLHSHVDEQPFTRSGRDINIGNDTQVLVRAHMNTVGYGGKAYKGSVNTGFREVKLKQGFAEKVEKLAPQPEGCRF